MSLHRAALAIVIAFVCTVRGTGTDRQQSAQSQSGTAAITGTVVTLSSGEPIADASVTLYGSTVAAGPVSTTTDSQGRFQFTTLAPGRYTVGAVKTGFVTVVFGERHYGRGGRAMALRDAEHRDIRLQLPHTSAITGRIVDAGGNPAIRASVRALRFTMAFGYRRALPVGSGNIDEKGVFRIDSLTPGDYAVCATTHETTPLNEGQRLRMEIDRQRRSVAYVLGPEGVAAQKRVAPRLAELQAQLPPYVPPVRGYAPVCYPRSTSPPSMITLAPDEERTGVDMQFVVTRLARIEGIVTGLPPGNGDLDPIMLLSADDGREGPPADSMRADIDGRFTFTNVSPGTYKLFLRSATNGSSPGSRISAAAQVIVADEDIRNVVLDLQPGVTVSGRVVFRGTRPQSPADVMARAGLEIRLDPAVPGPLTLWPGSSRTRPDETGQFVLHDVFPGEYRISTSQREARPNLRHHHDRQGRAGARVLHSRLSIGREVLECILVPPAWNACEGGRDIRHRWLSCWQLSSSDAARRGVRRMVRSRVPPPDRHRLDGSFDRRRREKSAESASAGRPLNRDVPWSRALHLWPAGAPPPRPPRPPAPAGAVGIT